MNTLNNDCIANIFSFLPPMDIISYSLSSSNSLKATNNICRERADVGDKLTNDIYQKVKTYRGVSKISKDLEEYTSDIVGTFLGKDISDKGIKISVEYLIGKKEMVEFLNKVRSSVEWASNKNLLHSSITSFIAEIALCSLDSIVCNSLPGWTNRYLLHDSEDETYFGTYDREELKDTCLRNYVTYTLDALEFPGLCKVKKVTICDTNDPEYEELVVPKVIVY